MKLIEQISRKVQTQLKGELQLFFAKFDKIQVTSKTEIEILEWTVSNDM